MVIHSSPTCNIIVTMLETKHDKNLIFNSSRIMFHRQVHLIYYFLYLDQQTEHYSPCKAFDAERLESLDKPESKFQVQSSLSEDEVSLCPILFCIL